MVISIASLFSLADFIINKYYKFEPLKFILIKCFSVFYIVLVRVRFNQKKILLNKIILISINRWIPILSEACFSCIHCSHTWFLSRLSLYVYQHWFPWRLLVGRDCRWSHQPLVYYVIRTHCLFFIRHLFANWITLDYWVRKNLNSHTLRFPLPFFCFAFWGSVGLIQKHKSEVVL